MQALREPLRVREGRWSSLPVRLTLSHAPRIPTPLPFLLLVGSIRVDAHIHPSRVQHQLPAHRTCRGADLPARVWQASSKADPRQQQDWALKWLQGGRAHHVSRPVGRRRSVCHSPPKPKLSFEQGRGKLQKPCPWTDEAVVYPTVHTAGIPSH
jgi:hypothetical protein